jgi:hypothetical protein
MIGCNGSVTHGYSKNEVQHAPLDRNGHNAFGSGRSRCIRKATRSMTHARAYHVTASRNGCTTQLQSFEYFRASGEEASCIVSPTCNLNPCNIMLQAETRRELYAVIRSVAPYYLNFLASRSHVRCIYGSI